MGEPRLKTWREHFWSQIGHFVWTFSTGMLWDVEAYYLADVARIATGAALGREIAQFPSKGTSVGWWKYVGGRDTWIDAAFFVLGFAVGRTIALVAGIGR